MCIEVRRERKKERERAKRVASRARFANISRKICVRVFVAHACVRARSVQRDGGDGKGRKSRVHWCGGRAAAKRRGGNGFCGGHERDARRRHSRPFLSPPRWRNSEGGTRRRGDGRSTISSDIERAVHTKREGCMYLCVRDGDETGYSI